MTEWGVVLVIIALVGLLSTIVAPIIKLNTTITKLAAIVEHLSSDLNGLVNRNASTHERIFEELNDHETRITVLEKKD